MGLTEVFCRTGQVRQQRLVGNHLLPLTLCLYVGFGQTYLLTDEENVGFPSEIDGLGRCFLLAYLQAADITDFVVLTFLDVAQLTGFGEHRPEHTYLIRAIAK